MSVKLVIMKTGQQIIADVKEMVVEDKTVGYYLIKPCLVELYASEGEEILINNAKTKFDIALYPWIPLAKGETVPIAMDWVVTFVDPVDNLMELYENNVVRSMQNS